MKNPFSFKTKKEENHSVLSKDEVFLLDPLREVRAKEQIEKLPKQQKRVRA